MEYILPVISNTVGETVIGEMGKNPDFRQRFLQEMAEENPLLLRFLDEYAQRFLDRNQHEVVTAIYATGILIYQSLKQQGMANEMKKQGGLEETCE